MNIQTPDTLTLEQRARIISEIEAIIYNQRENVKEEAEHSIDRIVETYAVLNPTALTNAWEEIVIQYIIDSLHPDDLSMDPEEYAESQWELLLKGSPRDYVINHIVEIKPESIEQAAQEYTPEHSQ